MFYLGIDPGRSGGIVALDADGVAHLTSVMPASLPELIRLFLPYGSTDGKIPCRAGLEHVWSTPGQGGAFKFGRNVGHLEMGLAAASIPYDQVLPKVWQRGIGVSYPPGSTDTEKKNITKRRAEQLFPRLTVTHAIADALLIAEFTRRSHRGSDHGQEEGGSAQATAEAQGRKADPRAEVVTRQSVARTERQGGGRSQKAAAARAAAAGRRRG